MVKALAVAVAVAALAGCAPEGDPAPVEVAYQISGSALECVDAAFQDERTYLGDRFTLCGWFCATYEGESSNEILLTFRFDEARQTWVREENVGRQSASPCP